MFRAIPLTALLLWAIQAPVSAANPAPHSVDATPCPAPVRPPEDVPPATWQAFLDNVDRFRACTNDAMEHHQAAARTHQAQARAAADAWNQFVKTSLNAPQDFPHPSDGRTRSPSSNARGIQETHGGLMGGDPHGELRPQFEAPPRDDERTITIGRRYR